MIILRLIAGILCFVGSAAVFNIATETGIMEFSLKVCIDCMIAGGLVILMTGVKGCFQKKKYK